MANAEGIIRRHVRYVCAFRPPTNPISLARLLVSNRTRIRIHEDWTKDAQIWVLLTRHLVDKHEQGRFISLNTVVHEDERTSQLPEKPLLRVSWF